MLEISFKANVDAVTLKLDRLAREQIPYAEARAVTQLAKLAAQAERKAIPEVFESPTPFTVGSVAVEPARKGLPIARVYVRDKAAQYLAPYEYGGVQYLGKKPADLVPVAAAANKYGNLPRGMIAKYLARPDVFIGPVPTKAGPLYGVWQRPAKVVALKFGRRGKAPKLADKLANVGTEMKLLVAFHPPVETRKRIGFSDRARTVALANFDKVFGRELAKAMATAR
ncbi:hypothetical protein [Paraburkholderia mimosarum]|uniref:hypothetical protein n=1 Tax=Paraburkholderia mimosarum TaxID=312026 RepID=UPI00040B7449|nr:hypothetical protein [Paraburkholderia mimosarum]